MAACIWWLLSLLQTFLEQTKTKFSKNYKGMNLSKITTTVGLNSKSLYQCPVALLITSNVRACFFNNHRYLFLSLFLINSWETGIISFSVIVSDRQVSFVYFWLWLWAGHTAPGMDVSVRDGKLWSMLGGEKLMKGKWLNLKLARGQSQHSYHFHPFFINGKLYFLKWKEKQDLVTLWRLS